MEERRYMEASLQWVMCTLWFSSVSEHSTEICRDTYCMARRRCSLGVSWSFTVIRQRVTVLFRDPFLEYQVKVFRRSISGILGNSP